jgi:uracil-DNA glycosylase family 4
MRPKEISRYLADLGWRDPIALPVEPSGPDTAPDSEPVTESADLEGLAKSLRNCARCRLSEKRKTIVFGEGAPNARVMFIGEGPGAEEDRTGRPFVGQAGQLLGRMIVAMGFQRGQTYIANVVKCRPPGNRDPKDDEIAACSEFLDRQVELIRPDVIVALGRFAANRLTGTDKPLGALRGRWSHYKGVPLLATYHPAYLLRTPKDKRKVWSDLKLVLAKLAQVDS